MNSRIAVAVLFLVPLAACMPAKEGPVQLRVPDDPTVTFKVWFKVGSHQDPPGKAGLAYLTGQMIAEASTRKHSLDEINRLLYPLASSYRIRVDREMTVLTGRTHLDNVELFLELFGDAYLRPGFLETDFQRLKSDQLNYLENTLRYQADEELAKAVLLDLVFEGTSYAHPPEGTVAGVGSITLEDVKAFYERYYVGANAEAAIGGGFDDELANRFAATLSERAGAAPEPVPPPPSPALESHRVRLVAKPDANASISFGFPIDVSRGERDFYALWLANSWLGEHRNSSSHLYQVIRGARGMNYGDYSYIEAFPGGGRRSMPPTHVARKRQLFEVWIRTLPNEQAHFAIRAAVRELERLVENGLSEEQFQLTREFLEKYSLHFADTTEARLGYALDDRFYGIGEPGHLVRFRKMMDELTREEVNAALKRHLRWDRLAIAVVSGDAEGLRTALAEESPSPMSYASEKPQAILDEDREIERYPLGIDLDAISIVPVATVFE